VSGPGALLREWRVRALLTQEQLAERAGLNARTVRGLESDALRRPRGATLQLLAEALGLTEDERRQLAGATTRTPPAASLPPADVPRQLPADVATFVGREAELAELDRLGGARARPVISAIDGMAGIGKTTLVVHAAHRLADQYPDGQLFLDLHGFTEGAAPVEPGAALGGALRALGVPDARIPAQPDDRAALYRSRLADRRVLVVLDNAADEAQVAPFLPGTPGSLVLVTSRRRLTGLDAAAVSLDVLPPAEAVDLFTRTVGEERLRSTPPALLADVVELCGRLPLAIRVAAARLRSRPAWTLAHLADRLRDHRSRLTELELGRPGVTAALDLSYRQLTGEQQRAYRLLSLHPGPDLDAHAAAALVGTSVRDAERLLDGLVDTHLLTEPAAGRYRFHDLVGVHAGERVDREDEADARRAALVRCLEWYLRTATGAVGVLKPTDRVATAFGAGAPVSPLVFSSAVDARAWCEAERRTLAGATRRAAEMGLHEYAWRLSWQLVMFLLIAAHSDEAVEIAEIGAAAAEHVGGVAGYVAARYLGNAYDRAYRYPEAAECLRVSLAGCRAAGDVGMECNVLMNLGVTRRHAGDLEGACSAYREALAAAARWERSPRGSTQAPNVAACRLNLGEALNALGRPHEAVDHTDEALALARRTGNRIIEGMALGNLADSYLATGDLAAAETHNRRAYDVLREIEAGDGLVEVLVATVRIMVATDRPDEAKAAYEEGMALLEGTGDPRIAELERAFWEDSG
jgi:transcriptional regulator with XRE-family HTH domain/tetratricopeptide (TPR) repeat protein